MDDFNISKEQCINKSKYIRGGGPDDAGADGRIALPCCWEGGGKGCWGGGGN